MRFYITTAITTLALALVIFITGKTASMQVEKSHFKRFKAKVIKVYDGDTVLALLPGGRKEKVRFLGIDTPELHHPDRPVEEYAKEARDYVKKNIYKKECIFEYNDTEPRDKYGRLLCYVYYEGRLINAELIKKGLAYAYVMRPYSKSKELVMLENVARKFNRGVWEYER